MFPWTFPPQVRGRPLCLIFHPYLGTRRSELYSCLSPRGLRKDPSSLLPVQTSEFGQAKFHSVLIKTNVLHWGVSMVQQHLPQQPTSEARKLPVLPAALSVDCPWPCCLSSLAISTSASPLPYHPAFPGQQVPSLSCTGPVCLTLLPLSFSHLLQTTNNIKTLKSSSNPCHRGAMQY